MFEISPTLLDQYIESARSIYTLHEQNRKVARGKHYKKLVENLERSIEVLSHVPGGWAGALIVKQKSLIKGTPKVGTWVAVIRCVECGGYHITDSLKPVHGRFVCRDCDGWCEIEHVEGSEARVNKAHAVSRDKFNADPTEGMDEKEIAEWEAKQRGDTHDRLAKQGHAEWVAEQGCSVRKQGSVCPWCDEREEQ